VEGIDVNSGQMLLAIGAMVLLGKLALSTNAFLADTDTLQLESEAVTTATTIGQSAIEKILVRGFDHNYPGDNDTVTTAMFVSPGSLGRDAGEMAGCDTTFNDIDDFMGFTDSVSTPRLGTYYVTCSVYYVRESSPYDSVGTATFLKRVDVSVTSSYMINPNDPLKLPVPIKVSRTIAYL
jgi:hypothetical protein